ncbi:hypothetical protein [Burkholderia semiarida]|uniref:hypothetical protein n=1 Tax=Burkholderia TaxID=32008 RepID=UPI0034581CE0
MVDESGRPVWRFIRCRVKPGQTVAFSAGPFSPPTDNRLAPRVGYVCAIDQGIAFFAALRCAARRVADRSRLRAAAAATGSR